MQGIPTALSIERPVVWETHRGAVLMLCGSPLCRMLLLAHMSWSGEVDMEMVTVSKLKFCYVSIESGIVVGGFIQKY